jgi:hypothetical protein
MTGLTRKQALALTRWTPETLRNRVRAGKLHPEKAGHLYLYDPVELYKVSDDAREALDELIRMAPITESGQHWTEAYRRWRDLEEAGLIDVHRPVHPQTGIRYSQEYWHYRFTETGEEIARELVELIEDGYFL